MRILLLTNDFPSPWLPTKGTFNFELARALGRENEVQVVAPIPWSEELRNRPTGPEFVAAARTEARDGLMIHYPRYFYPPKVGRLWYDRFLWHSVRNTLNEALADFQPDAVVGYWTHPDGAVALRYARQIGAAAFVMVGGSDVLVQARRSRRRRQVITATLQQADGVFAVSGDLRRRIIGLGVPADRVHLVYRGVDRAQFAPGDRFAARERLGITHALPMFLWVGRMAPVKGLDVLLRAVHMLKNMGEAFEIALIGDGAERAALERMTRDLDLQKFVRFVGPIPHADLADWYRAADWSVLTSRSEGVPNVLLESHACGIPFIATRVGGVEEIAIAGIDRLAPAGDSQEFGRQMAEALTAPPVAPDRIVARVADLDATARKVVCIMQTTARKPPPHGNLPTNDAVMPIAAAEQPAARERKHPLRQMARHLLATFLPRRMFLTEGPLACGQVCLTFDDGPHPEHTPRLLDALADLGIKATFFVIGREAARHRRLVQRIAEEGHALGNHAWSHPKMAGLPARELADEVCRTRDLLAEITGTETVLFRPPMGVTSARQLLSLWGLRQAVVLWNRDPRDYQCRSTAELLRRLPKPQWQEGNLVLLHDNHPYAAEAVPSMAADVRATGLRFATITEWLGLKPSRDVRSSAEPAEHESARF